ncbi:hypothetical protein PGT21_012798 [Puccinia graminis f. sp. tritici]|uniref:Uncharacterized protein n=1 Tax=Puccinia graminis f. sp. tritici TaxID=56615 RepID=A0A5B0LU96_PUCGR|nr:hypothetical protein PGT21_012798 [Puccinia graminis f. sp. tritici]
MTYATRYSPPWADPGQSTRAIRQMAEKLYDPMNAGRHQKPESVEDVGDWNGVNGTRHRQPRALDCGRGSLSTSRTNPNQTRTPNDQKTPLDPSQGASQLNQTTQRLYIDRPVILTSKGYAAAHSAQQQ